MPSKCSPPPLDRLGRGVGCSARPLQVLTVHALTHKLILVSSLSVVVCELPLLEGVAGFTWVEAKSVPLRTRLQAHVVGHKLRYEVLPLCRHRTGNIMKERLHSFSTDSNIFHSE